MPTMNNTLVSLSEEELSKVKPPTDEEIKKAIDKGIKARLEFLETQAGYSSIPRPYRD